MMKYRLNEPVVGDLEIEYTQRVIESGWLGTGGEFTTRFEQEFAQLHGCQYGFAVQSGTAALHTTFWSVLHGLCAKSSKEPFKIAVPDFTCAATAAAVVMAGGLPVLVDVEEDTFGMDVELLEVANSLHRLEAVALVHMYGTPARDTERIRDFCRKHGVKLIEDAAEAHGASFEDGQSVGSIGDVATFSLRSEKAMGVGEGGICITNDEELMRVMRWFGHRCSPPGKWHRRYFTEDIGMNYPLAHLLGAVACAQMQRLPSMLKRRREIAALYRDMLPEFIWHTTTPYSTVWLNFLQFPMEPQGELLERIGDSLMTQGVEVRSGFWPLHDQPAFVECPRVSRSDWDAGFCSADKLPWVSDYIAATGLCVPSHPQLTDEDIEDICRIIQEVWSDAGAQLP